MYLRIEYRMTHTPHRPDKLTRTLTAGIGLWPPAIPDFQPRTPQHCT